MKIVGKSATEIFECVRKLAQSGEIQAGTLLPPVRDLATQLDVNRNTVAAAYKRLVGAGIAVAQGRLGTSIRQPTTSGEQEGATLDSPLTDLASGNPSLAWLPDLNEIMGITGYRPRLYGEPTVSESLRAHAEDLFSDASLPSFEVEASHGAVDGMERILGAHLVAGDSVVVETPCFLGSINTLRANNLVPVGIPIDREGMQIDPLEAALKNGTQAVIITPRAHNPSACGLSLSRARALKALFRRYPHVLIIADDHFSLLSGQTYHDIIPSSTKRWAVIRSVSKALGPDLRFALIATDSDTASRLRLRMAPGSTWVSHVLQDMVSTCLSNPVQKKQRKKAARHYAQRMQCLIEALDRHDISVPPDQDGLNLWLPVIQDSRELAHALARRGWLLRSGDAFSVGETTHGLRITISDLTKEQARRLATDIHTCMQATPESSSTQHRPLTRDSR